MSPSHPRLLFDKLGFRRSAGVARALEGRNA